MLSHPIRQMPSPISRTAITNKGKGFRKAYFCHSMVHTSFQGSRNGQNQSNGPGKGLHSGQKGFDGSSPSNIFGKLPGLFELSVFGNLPRGHEIPVFHEPDADKGSGQSHEQTRGLPPVTKLVEVVNHAMSVTFAAFFGW